MRAWGSAAAVIAALRDDAAAERERLEGESARVMEALSTDAGAKTPSEGDAGSDRLEAVRRGNAEADAAEDWEDTVAAAADRDAWIAAVAEAGRRAIAAAPDAQRLLERLTREAVLELPGEACIVAVPSALVTGAEAWRAVVERDTHKRFVLEPAAFAAGCVARTPDGRVTFDNTVEARERRSRTAWRTAIARLYDEARDAVTVEAT